MTTAKPTEGLYVPPLVLVDEAAGWAWVHQGGGSDAHTLDLEHPDVCAVTRCSPQRTALKGGDETPDELTPPVPKTAPGEHAVACRHEGCDVTGVAETPELALALITAHGRADHGEGKR